jgi:hypothetical protein
LEEEFRVMSYFIGEEKSYNSRGLQYRLNKSKLEYGIKNSRSMRECSRFLNVSYNTLKKYCEIYGLWTEDNKNQSGKGICKERISNQ